MRLYAVTRPDFPEDQSTVIVAAREREQAKNVAWRELQGVSDQYVVEPLPLPGDSARIVWREPDGRKP